MLRRPGRGPVATTTIATFLGATGLAVGPVADAQALVGGAAVTPGAPTVTRIVCLSGCVANGTVERGGRISLRGRRLDLARAVVFLGGRGTRDDVRVRVRPRSPKRIDVPVPRRARSGRVAVVAATGAVAASPARALKVVRPGTVRSVVTSPTLVLAPVRGIPQLEAGVALRRVGTATSSVTVAYVANAPQPLAVRVDIVRTADGLSVFSHERLAAANERSSVTWDGRADGGVATDGRYEVRITARDGATERDAGAPVPLAGGAAPATAPPGAVRLATFEFRSAVFPVRGQHDYGGAGARFGAGRGDHAHQGQDVMAACGTPVVAARGGTVKQKARQSAAGNYLVIRDELTGNDHVYMHLREPALVARGARVTTGELIGFVGATGRATACHLHFEIWSAPGWYEGGTPIDPLPTLRRWDRLG